MLQRIQSVFLLLIVILMILFTIFPVWTSSPESEGTVIRLYSFFLFSGPADNPQGGTWQFWPYFLSGGLSILAIIIALIETFSYKKRMKQIKLGALNTLLLAGVLISTVWFVSQEQAEWIQISPGKYSIGIFFPAMAMIFNLLANRFIRKDENLIRSMDRIR